MTDETAAQYLIWALEQIEKAGNQKAASHVRVALQELRPDQGPATAQSTKTVTTGSASLGS
ncbi:hypothetical protein JQ543_13625 [Bradyrhizobium diazoefficiens]|nr:hypothetical protein [Bradyrhizobium diazoefficiens]MBR0848787.1 hypothetical protein [Bradyrhizobium diazoefficiens]